MGGVFWMVDNQSAKAAYELWHGRLDVDSEADTPWHRMVKAHLSREDLAGKSVLEIGCGRGGLALWLASQEHVPQRIVAADFSATAVQKGETHARAMGLSGITWSVEDIQAISYPDNSFDTVISCETIEHVPDQGRALSELRRVLKPGGRLFLTTPNYLGSLGMYRIYCELRGRGFTEEGQPINRFMVIPKTRHLVASAGLRIKRQDGVGHYLPFPGRPPIELAFLNNPRALMKWF